MIKQNRFIFCMKSGVCENERIPGKKLSAFPGLWRRSQSTKPSKALDANMKEGHLRNLPFDHGIKSLWNCEEIESVCVRHKPETLENPFAGLLSS